MNMCLNFYSDALAFCDGPQSVYGVCFSLDKSTSHPILKRLHSTQSVKKTL